MSSALDSPDCPKAIGYCRVSSKKQATGGGSLEAQREAIIRESVLEGLNLVDVYVDGGISGGKDERRRPGLAEALDSIKSKRASVLIVAHSDRLARDTDLAGYLRVRVKQAGGRVISIGEVKDDPIRAAVDRMLAELERVRGSQRMKFFHATRRAKGLHAGPAPYGFRTGADGRLEPVPEEVPVVERITAMKAQGASLRTVAAALNADRIPTRSGRPWNAQTVLKILVRARLAEPRT